MGDGAGGPAGVEGGTFEEGATLEERIARLERALASVQEDARVAHILLGLSSAVADVRTDEQTLEEAVRIVPELFRGERCFAATWDQAAGRFRVRARTGYDTDAARALDRLAARPDSLPLVAEALREDSPLLIHDTSADARMVAVEAKGRGVGAYVGIPLRGWGDEAGGLVVELARPRCFGPSDESLARGISRQVGVALANARRFHLLRGLRSFGLRVGSRLRLAPVIKEIVAASVELLNAHSSRLYFLDTDKRSYVAAGDHNLPADVADKLNHLVVASAPWSRLHQGEAVVINDLAAELDLGDGLLCAVASPMEGSGREPLGVLIVFFDRSFRLGQEETEALRVASAQAATAIENARRFERQRRVARSLQEGLVSTSMPTFRGCEIKAVYEPASSESDVDVGGDFFDAFELPDGRIALVIGDVSGKGAEAAAQTAMAKYMLRAFATVDPEPEVVLFELNNALLQGLDEDRFTTLAYGVFDPSDGSCRVAIGGHPAPMVLRKDTGEIDQFEHGGMVLGAFEDLEFDGESVKLENGDVVVAFTDGLVEARVGNDLYGRDRVTESLKRHSSRPPADLVRRLLDDAKAFGSVSDDTVVLALMCVRPSE